MAMKNKMKLVSHYTQYGDVNNWDENSPVKCVCDDFIYRNERTGKQVMLLIEPRSIQPNVYEYALQVYDQYEYVFTHDSQLLKTLPNAKPILWGGVWCRLEEIDINSLGDKKKYIVLNPKKNKLISMLCSDKELCELHKERKRIARKYKDKIDVYGTIDGGNYCDPIDSLENYMYSVVIENYIDDLWFTEKICNCFATKTIPIYYGARDIGKYFNEEGIIICHNLEELEISLNAMLNFPEEYEYFYYNEDVQKILNENYELSKQYEKFDEWLYKTYEKEIGELFK